jgi:hypothetical protein
MTVYSSFLFWKELSVFSYTALNILIISSMSNSKELVLG